MCRVTFREVRDGSENPRRGPGRVGGKSGRFGMGRETLGEVRDGSEVSRGGPIRVGGPAGMSG